MVRQQEALARNQETMWRPRKLNSLESVLKEYGDDPETLGILGRVYKDIYKDAKKKNDGTASAILEKAIDTYTRGFYSEPRNYYPGINAINLLIEKGSTDSYEKAKGLIPIVYFAADRSIGPSSNDYWALATLLEINCINNDYAKMQEILPKVLSEAKESWMAETTMDNIKLLRESLPNYYIDKQNELKKSR
jgi:hypothetical protein